MSQIGPSISRQSTLQQLSQVDGPKPKEKEGLVQSPNQRQMLSAKLTPPPTPKPLSAPREDLISSVSIKAKTTETTTCPSRKEVAERLLDKAKDKAKDARQMGVDVAKTTFWKKMITVAASAVAVGVAIGLTAISFGGAAPLLGLACATMAVAIGDAVCTYRNYKNTEAEANHQPLPYAKLPAGNSFLANVGYKAATMLGASESTAQLVGKGLAVVVGGGLVISTIALSCGLGTVPLALAITAKTASGINAAVSGYSALSSLMSSDLDKDHIERLNSECGDLTSRATENDSEIDGSGVLEGAQEAMSLYEKAVTQSDVPKDIMVGLGGVLGPLGGLAFDALLGPPPDSHTTPSPQMSGVWV
jgi:hypothetical protein